ncbi:purine catabolism regulator [Rhodococcus sp. AG1013]|uniref:PucR family transcriptional regulator n=1 Tax=Rhodococcus sp. AG1013 TaxID=2183996 RepID=UPI000E0AC701|nr:PucR family transcriptional regulator [Rhodococcus sp. AG1013]RDI18445.1 purine catabolism regulator [Rhodococcus sp. AG1013]
MSVTVRWVLAQPELSLRLRGGASGLDRDIEFAITTELSDPSPWLSGGELLLTTGLGAPSAVDGYRDYLRRLFDAGVAAVGFGVGLTHSEIPEALIAAADETGLPLLEVPLPTPFAAVTKRVMDCLAEQRYDALLRASRAQPRMTRAVVQGGARAIVRELAVATDATVLLFDRRGRLLERHPTNVDGETVTEVSDLIDSVSEAASSIVAQAHSGHSMTVQRIGLGTSLHGCLAVVSPKPLGSVDQVLLGHANSLLALDFEKPVRLRAAQNQLNSQILGLLLSEGIDLEPAREQLAPAADDRGFVRALAGVCPSSGDAEAVASSIASAMNEAGRPLFLRRTEGRMTVLLRGTDDVAFARTLLAGAGESVRRSARIGLSGPLPVERFAEAIDQAQLAASAAGAGAAPLEFSALTGSALLTFDSTRQVLRSVADTMITPLADHDRDHGTELVASLRAFLEANGHWESAANVLGVHRHTLRSRIAKIESLLDCRLDVARVRAELLLAIIASQA